MKCTLNTSFNNLIAFFLILIDALIVHNIKNHLYSLSFTKQTYLQLYVVFKFVHINFEQLNKHFLKYNLFVYTFLEKCCYVNNDNLN